VRRKKLKGKERREKEKLKERERERGGGKGKGEKSIFFSLFIFFVHQVCLHWNTNHA
jgi:hypothetical protein